MLIHGSFTIARVVDDPEIITLELGRLNPDGTLARALRWAAIVISFVPGIWILLGALLVGPEKSFAVVGAVFLAGAFGIWWSAWALVDRVAIRGDQISWRGIHTRGSAPLRTLRRVRLGRWPRQGSLAFEFAGRRGFSVLCARDLGIFVDAVLHERPDLVVDAPRGRMESRVMGRARVVVVAPASDGRRAPPALKGH